MADSFVSRFGCYTIIWDTTDATVQGKPVARRGRKARDLPVETARPPGPRRDGLKESQFP